MWELLTHPSNIFFSISLCLLFFLGTLEIVLLFLGSGSQGLLDQFLSEDLSSSKDVNVHIDGDSSLFSLILDWLYIGRIPLLVWFIIFLTTYSLTGLITQAIYHQFLNSFVSAWIIAPICLFIAMPIVRYSAMIISKFLPQDETTAIYSHELIGRHATIILGKAQINSPAEAKVIDQHAQTHYVLVEPELDEVFNQGDTVLLTEKTTLGFKAIKN